MHSTSETLYLEDYIDSSKRYLVEHDSLARVDPEVSSVAETMSRNVQGFGSLRTLGLVKLCKTLVAVFSDGHALKLALAGKVFDLMEGDAKAYAFTHIPFVKFFRVEQYGRVAFQCRYWFVERDDYWPENDIFLYVARATSSEVEKRRSMLWWNETAAGRDTSRPEFVEFLDKLDTTR